jgi:inosine/xanthosine triphosphatase
MKKVVIASENPVKVNVAKRAFQAVYPDEQFEFVAVKSESGVPDQPMNGETKIGAYNRLNFIKEKFPEADFWISQEGGLYEDGDNLCNRAWIVVADRDEFVGESSTAHFRLPLEITKSIRSGMELSHAGDAFFNTKNTGRAAGVVGELTEGLIDREEYYVPAAIIALSQVKHREWY